MCRKRYLDLRSDFVLAYNDTDFSPGGMSQFFGFDGKFVVIYSDGSLTGGVDSHDHAVLDEDIVGEPLGFMAYNDVDSSSPWSPLVHSHLNLRINFTSVSNTPTSFEIPFSILSEDEFDDLSLPHLYFAESLPPLGYIQSSLIGRYIRGGSVFGSLYDALPSESHDLDSYNLDPSLEERDSCDTHTPQGYDCSRSLHTHDIVPERYTLEDDGFDGWETDELDRVEVVLISRKTVQTSWIVSEEIFNWKCFGKEFGEDGLCCGRGECVSTDNCTCSDPDDYFFGDSCQNLFCDADTFEVEECNNCTLCNLTCLNDGYRDIWCSECICVGDFEGDDCGTPIEDGDDDDDDNGTGDNDEDDDDDSSSVAAGAVAGIIAGSVAGGLLLLLVFVAVFVPISLLCLLFVLLIPVCCCCIVIAVIFACGGFVGFKVMGKGGEEEEEEIKELKEVKLDENKHVEEEKMERKRQLQIRDKEERKAEKLKKKKEEKEKLKKMKKEEERRKKLEVEQEKEEEERRKKLEVEHEEKKKSEKLKKKKEEKEKLKKKKKDEERRRKLEVEEERKKSEKVIKSGESQPRFGDTFRPGLMNNKNLMIMEAEASAPTLTPDVRNEIFGVPPIEQQPPPPYFEINADAPTLNMAAAATILSAQQRQSVKKSFETIQKLEDMKRQNYVIPYEDLKIDFDKCLGSGVFGMVYKCTWNYSKYAVKILKIEHKMTPSVVEEFVSEADILTKLRHPNLITVFGVVIGAQYCIVMEYLEYGSLYKFLHSDEELGWNERIAISMDIGKGILHLHKNQILHRDLKSLNVLVHETNGLLMAKLCDFGLAKVKKDVKSSISQNENLPVGTIRWMAPELFCNEEYSEESDIYSFGIIMWEIATRRKPFKGFKSMKKIVGEVKGGYRESVKKYNDKTPTFFRRLIKKCTLGDPKQRPNVKEILDTLDKGLKEYEE